MVIGLVTLSTLRFISCYILQLISRQKTPAEIIEEYERLKKEDEERQMNLKTNPVSSVTMEIDATDCFDTYHLQEALNEELEHSVPYLAIIDRTLH